MFKREQVGTVKVSVEEVRELSDINYLIVSHDGKEHETAHIHPKRVSDQKWTESYEFAVHSLQSDVLVNCMHKAMLVPGEFGKKIKAQAKVPLPSLQDEKEHHEWYPLYKYVNPKKLAKNIAKKRKQVGEVRIKVQYISIKDDTEQAIAGITKEGEWKRDAGKLMVEPLWMNNPQFLLNVKKNRKPAKHVNVRIRLIQPDESEGEKSSFYVLRYDEDMWEDKKLLLHTNSDLIKLSQDAICPIFSDTASGVYSLKKGKYVVIPCNENPYHIGKFTMAFDLAEEEALQSKGEENSGEASDEESSEAYISDKKEISKYIQISELGDETWNERQLESEWTKETAGGGNITGVNWRRNPQFVLLSKSQGKDEDSEDDDESDESEDEDSNSDMVCLVISQEGKDSSIGFYVLEYKGIDKKTTTFENQHAATPSFKFQCTNGAIFRIKHGSKYVVIPCTREPSQQKFTLRSYSTAPVELYELTETWEFRVRKKYQWLNNEAAGAPNQATFHQNPQFLLDFPQGERTEFVLDLVVNDDVDGIGFVVVERDSESDGRVTREEIIDENIFLKTPGWKDQMTVSMSGVITAKKSKNFQYVFIPSTLKPGREKVFQLTCYSDTKVKLVQLDSPYQSEEAKAAANKRLSFIRNSRSSTGSRKSLSPKSSPSPKLKKKGSFKKSPS